VRWLRGMRTLLVILTLTSFGCAELRYPTRTAMVEVAPEPVRLVPPTSAPEHSAASRRRTRRNLQIGGAIASAIGAALVIGGAFGVHKQQVDNAAAEADCNAQGGWFCGAFDGLSYLPYAGLLVVGAGTAIAGLALIGIGADRGEHEGR